MHKFYKNSGWTQIKGQIGRGGIDGLYYKEKDNVIKEILVSESKWNKSNLGFSGEKKTIKQMSQKWVLGAMDKLIKKMGNDTYSTLKYLISNNQYRARLFRLKPKGDQYIQISIYKIKNKGLDTFSTIKDSQLRPIDINFPKNKFEMEILSAYNECRTQYLHKYLDFLTDSEIAILLKDNYIKKSDVKNVLLQ
jgi:hypothetical protein